MNYYRIIVLIVIFRIDWNSANSSEKRLIIVTYIVLGEGVGSAGLWTVRTPIGCASWIVPQIEVSLTKCSVVQCHILIQFPMEGQFSKWCYYETENKHNFQLNITMWVRMEQYTTVVVLYLHSVNKYAMSEGKFYIENLPLRFLE